MSVSPHALPDLPRGFEPASVHVSPPSSLESTSSPAVFASSSTQRRRRRAGGARRATKRQCPSRRSTSSRRPSSPSVTLYRRTRRRTRRRHGRPRVRLDVCALAGGGASVARPFETEPTPRWPADAVVWGASTCISVVTDDAAKDTRAPPRGGSHGVRPARARPLVGRPAGCEGGPVAWSAGGGGVRHRRGREVEEVADVE